MVPLNPNELKREPLEAIVRETTSTGIWNGFDDTIDDRCAFSLHNKNVIDNTCVENTGDIPSQLSIDSHDRCHQRSHHQRRQARGRGGRLQMTHVRLQRRALDWCGTVFCRLAQRPRRGAHLQL